MLRYLVAVTHHDVAVHRVRAPSVEADAAEVQGTVFFLDELKVYVVAFLFPGRKVRIEVFYLI